LDYRGPTVANATHAYLHRDSRMIDLGAPQGAFNPYGYDLNNAGWVVGRSETLVGEFSRAFLCADGKMYDLNHLLKDPIDGTLGSADGVNER
jgi:probable HAF family extracellular repeat protein